jgi:hypothetical protein
MDRSVFMTFDDFVKINALLLKQTQLSLFRAEDYVCPFVLVRDIDNQSSWHQPGRQPLLIGKFHDADRIIGATNVLRSEKIGFVSIRYGEENKYAIGATRYSADKSDTEKLVSRELDKLLKKYAHKGTIGQFGYRAKTTYWTDAALSSRKHWHEFLRKEEESDFPGQRPLQAYENNLAQ